jgi:hypothetical protein
MRKTVSIAQTARGNWYVTPVLGDSRAFRTRAEAINEAKARVARRPDVYELDSKLA